MALQDTLGAMKADFDSGRVPLTATAGQLRRMDRATDERIASGPADRALGVVDAAPDFERLDQTGTFLRSRDPRAAGPLVLSFHRGVRTAPPPVPDRFRG